MRIRSLRCLLPLLLALAWPGRPTKLLAQDIPGAGPNPVLVEALAPLLMAEDQRSYDSVIFLQGLRSQYAQVRRAALLGLGRIGDHRATALMLPLLLDPDPGVIGDAFFALGVLGDTAAVSAIVARLERPDSLTADGVSEAATALARIGGPRAGQLLGRIITTREPAFPAKRLDAFRVTGLLDAWRLGVNAPVPEIQSFTGDRNADLRYAAIFTLARLHTPAAGQVILRALRDVHPLVQEIAARALTKPFADSAGLAATVVTSELVGKLVDVRSGLRTNALFALATWHDPALVLKVRPLLSDAVLNVQVQAAMTLAGIGGSAAALALDNALMRKDATWALKRAALLGLAATDPAQFGRRAAAWQHGLASGGKTPDWREQVVALEGWGRVAPTDPAVFQAGLADPKPAVIAAALAAWHTARPNGDPLLLTAARARLRDTSEVVRVAAIEVLGSQATVDDLDGLMAAWQLGTSTKTLDDRMALIDVIDSMVRRIPATVQLLSEPSRQMFFMRPTDQMGMLLRREAELRWPLLAQRWGPSVPMTQSETGRSLDDYRGIVRTFVLADENPHVTVDLGGTTLDIELLGHDAPLTVANFVRLVKANYFDQNRWHRVVPYFVVQTGDPTGTGDGGPGWAVRAEINRRRYVSPMVGMADAGLDTGGGQWFINISAQPHLDGRYTVFGRVASGDLNKGFSRITQGDVIRSIRLAAPPN